MSKFHGHLKKLADLCSRHKFIVESTVETTQGPQSVFEYGHLGAEMRRNLRNIWWQDVVTSKETVHGVELSMLDVNEYLPLNSAPDHRVIEVEYLIEKLRETNLKDKESLKDIISRNSMGMRAASKIKKNIPLENSIGSQPAVPAGYAWYTRGVSIATEETEMLRNIENDLLCLRFLCEARTFKYWFNFWRRQRIVWWRKLANNPSNFSSYDIPQKNGNSSITENQYDFPWGKEEIESFSCDSTDVNSNNMHKHEANLFTIRMTTNLNKGFVALLSDAYEEKDIADISGVVDRRSILHLHPSVAPYKVAIHRNDSDTNELIEVCHQLASELRQAGISTCNERVGRSEDHVFAHHDEIGTPYCVTVLPSTLSNGVVALRNRDTTLQEFLHISDVLKTLQSHLNFF